MSCSCTPVLPTMPSRHGIQACANDKCGKTFILLRKDSRHCCSRCANQDYARISAKDNPERSAETKKRWERNNYHKSCASKRKWRVDNPEKQIAAYRKCRWASLLANAKSRNLEVTITHEEYEEFVTHPCFYCGWELEGHGSSIDRINNSLGYIPGNCRPCCTPCNLAKRVMTEEQFKTWVTRIYKHWIGKNA